MPKGVYDHRRQPLEERIWSKIEPEPNSGCWIWIGYRQPDGYGQVGTGGHEGVGRAHRVVYEHYRGPIPSGLQLDHLCRMRWCVNPWHLEVVTQAVNLHRGAHPVHVANRTGVCLRGHRLTEVPTYIRNGYVRCAVCISEGQRERRRRHAA
jgi:hypothetical protein